MLGFVYIRGDVAPIGGVFLLYRTKSLIDLLSYLYTYKLSFYLPILLVILYRDRNTILHTSR